MSTRDTQPLNSRQIFKVDITGHHNGETETEHGAEAALKSVRVTLKQDIRKVMKDLATSESQIEKNALLQKAMFMSSLI